ncbi:concanavalin A-like lectin/glucanase domain-containing protein [Xylariales sp. PMI_506]|nr:concanavalin A-like lectin/glucanase domain-containing protein [Xylariales sp. PMI_506]
MRPKEINPLALAAVLGLAYASDELVEPLSKDNSDSCQCYLVQGPDPGYFLYHRFWDFRNISSDGSNDFTVAPPHITDQEDNGGQLATSLYLNSTTWDQDWSFLDGVSTSSSDSPVPNVYSMQNVYISRNTTAGGAGSTFLTLRATRADDFMSSSQITSQQQNLLHASIRGRMRVIPNGLGNDSAPSVGARLLDNPATGSNANHPVDVGAVVGFFTYASDTQESDIEILTRDGADQIHYSNQPDYDAAADEPVPGASTQLGLPDGLSSTDWMEHRLDWFDGVVRWWVNGQLVLNKTVNAPTQPSGLILNVWGNGGEWSGNMTVGGEVTLGVEWLEMAFNVSGPVGGGSGSSHHTTWTAHDGLLFSRSSGDAVCKVGCAIDGVQQVGFPEVAYDSIASPGFGGRGLSAATESLLVAFALAALAFVAL